MNIYNQYGNFSNKEKMSPEKTISRQIGGMKAQGVTSITVDVDGNSVDLPKMSYVELLEIQVKQLRETVNKLEKQLIVTNNKIQRLSNNIKHTQLSGNNKRII